MGPIALTIHEFNCLYKHFSEVSVSIKKVKCEGQTGQNKEIRV